MEYRDDFSNAESAAIEAYTSMAVRHTMLLLLGITTMMASIVAIALAATGTVLDLLGVAELHDGFAAVAAVGLGCGAIDFIARRRDNDYVAGLATIAGQGALTTAGVVALLGWFSSGWWVVAVALAAGATTSSILFKYPEWEIQAQQLERFVRVPPDGDDGPR